MYENLKKLRLSLGMTQSEFGKSIGVAKTTYNNYETGEREPKSNFWISIAKVYGVTIDYLMGYSNDPHRTSLESEGENVFSTEAQKIAEQFDELDDFGKNAVRCLVEIEHARCSSKLYEAKIHNNKNQQNK